MKLQPPKVHPAVVIAVLVLIAVLLVGVGGDNDPAKESFRERIIKNGFVAVLLAAAFRLALGAVGWPLWVLSAVAFVGSGAAGDVVEGIKAGVGGTGSAGDSANDRSQLDVLCRQYGGFGYYVVAASNCRKSCACADGVHYAHIGCT